MKNKLLIIFSLMLICVFSLVNTSFAKAESLSLSYYEKTSCVTIDSSSDGGIFYASSVGHYDIINMYFGEDKSSIAITDDTWIHMKGIVSSNIYRIKVIANGSTCQSRLFDTSKPDNGLIKLNDDRTFEVHYKAKDFLNTDTLNKLGFQVYVNGDNHISGSHNESIELLGIVFNNEQNYSNWSTPVEREEHICDWSSEWSNDASYHWHVCLNGCKTLKDYSSHTYLNGICTVCSASEPGELSFGLINTESQKVSLENTLENGTGKITFIEDGTASINIPVENVLTTSHKWLSIKLKVTDGVEIKAYADETYICADIFGAWNAKNYLETYDEYLITNIRVDEYLPSLSHVENVVLSIEGVVGNVVEIMDITFTFDGKHNFETPVVDPVLPDEGPISDIQMPKGFDGTYSKNENGEQTITYNKSPEYKTFDIKINEYDPTNTILEVIFEASTETTVCIQINDKIDWSLGGHNLYPGERTSKIIIDLTSFDYELTEEFNINIYIDAVMTVTESKSITFKSITFKTPDPEPDGMYISNPTSSGMSCFSGALGDEVKWSYGDWSYVNYKINKYETDYDVLRINMSVVSGMNLGIRITYTEEVNGEIIESNEDIRNHWTTDGLFDTTGNVELVFLLKSYNLINKNITNISLYFDPPTNNYTPNEGLSNATIYSVDFYKSSDLNLKPLNIVANPMAFDYTGEKINFVASNQYDYEMIYEYSTKNSTDWTTDAPINAGVYDVRITFLGSLTHDYSETTSTLTINKVKATVSENDIYVNPDTGEVTINKGIIAALSEDFNKDSLIRNGFIVEDNTVIYFYYPADSNHHIQSEVLRITVKLNSKEEVPSEPEVPSGSEIPSKPETVEPENNTNTNDSGCGNGCNGGCSGSIVTSILGLLTLAGVAVLLKRKNKE